MTDFTNAQDLEAFRARVLEFLREHLPAGWKGFGALDPPERERFMARWRAALLEAGLLALTWPEHYGGAGRTELEAVVLAEELTRAGVPLGDQMDRFGIAMLGNTLLRWGREDQCRWFLPRILSGADRWCQGFSEPEAGSDLAALRCRASRVGDEWIVEGQKIWTSLAFKANWIFLLVRTDPNAAKHHGISFLLCPLDQPGVEIRRIRMMNGQEEFCEVFFEGARVPVDNVVGEVHGGWPVATTLLTFERGGAAATFPLMFREEFERLVELARTTGRLRTRGSGTAWPTATGGSRSCASWAYRFSPTWLAERRRDRPPRSPSCTGVNTTNV